MSDEGAAAPTPRRHGVAMALLLTVVALYGTLFGDRIPIRQGRGWDGDLYVTAAADPAAGWAVVHNQPFLFQRLAPSMMVYCGLAITGSPRDDGTVLLAFTIFNTALLLITLWLWLAVAGQLKLSLPARWLGFLGLFANVQCFKVAYWYPALTDIPALALGMAVVYAFLRRRTLAIVALSLIGAFTWPVAGPMGALLVLFPREPKPGTASQDPGPEEVARPASTAARTIAAVSAVAVTALPAHLFYVGGVRTAGWGPVVPAVESLYPFSLLVTAVYIFVVAASFLPEPSLTGVKDLLGRLRPANVILAGIVLVAPRLAVWAFTTGVEATTVGNIIPYTFFLSTTRPAIFLVGHLVFFGPVLLLLPFVWERLRAFFQWCGPGAQLYMIVGLMVAACPDSRQSTLLLPMLIVALVWGCDRAGLVSNGLLVTLAGLAFFMSRIWLPFSVPTSARPADPLELGWDISRYYETQGSYMTEPHYLAALLGGGLLLFLLSAALPSSRGLSKRQSANDSRYRATRKEGSPVA